MGKKNFKNTMEKRQFKELEKQADKNISKIFNPEDAYQRKQKEILRAVFGEDYSCSVIKNDLIT